MNSIPNESNDEPAMRYEGIVRYAFDCDNGGGPNNIADATVFDMEFIPKITQKGIQIMNEILEALIVKANNNKKELISLKDSLSNDIEQQSAIELINYIIKLTKEDIEH